MAEARNVAILIFNEVEVLDFAGPFEVFSVFRAADDERGFDVYTVAETLEPVSARNGLVVTPKHTIYDCPRPDILVVPGGYGTRSLVNNTAILDFIEERAEEAELVLSVCTGSLLLGKIGLLDDLPSTTHFLAFDELRKIAPKTTVQEGKRFVDNGRVVVSAGVSAGIDMTFHILDRLHGRDKALETARYMEYDWRPES